MTSKAKTVTQYLASLSADRRATMMAVRKTVLKNLPAGYKEGMLYGMIGYYIPLKKFPHTYNGQPIGIAALGHQKHYMALYLMGVYGHKPLAEWFHREWKKTGKKLDMGKSCLRFKKLDDLDVDIIGKTIAKVSVAGYIQIYKRSRHYPKKK